MPASKGKGATKRGGYTPQTGARRSQRNRSNISKNIDNSKNSTTLVETARSAEHRGLMGCDAYSLRVGGAQHLGAHIRQHGELHLAGGWAQGSPMPLHYAGASIEATRWWAALMVQPVGLLRAGGRPAMHFEL